MLIPGVRVQVPPRAPKAPKSVDFGAFLVLMVTGNVISEFCAVDFLAHFKLYPRNRTAQVFGNPGNWTKGELWKKARIHETGQAGI